jgi:membrane fusion protein (multidrug efflux system)
MSTAFSRSIRLLEADRPRRSSAGLLAAAALLAGWAAWSALAHVTLYEVTTAARVEVDRAIYPVQSSMPGRVTRTWLSVGHEVHAGDLLVELDTSAEHLQVEEERTRLASIPPQVEALRQQIVAEQSARTAERQASQVAGEEAQANARQAETPAKFNAAEEERLRQLHAEGLISERDYLRGRADAQQSRFGADRDQISIRRIEQEQRTRESDRETRIRALQTEITRLDGLSATSRAAIQRLDNEAGRRAIRAPVSGRLGETATLRAGAVLHEGDQVAAIIPDGRLLIVAQFAPQAALGRLASGQRAQVRLDGFPWMQYGAVQAVVSRVASEVREGAVRVELAVDSSQPMRIPLQHGLPGSVEVAVEQVTPATLILRTAGRLIASPRSAFPVRKAAP